MEPPEVAERNHGPSVEAISWTVVLLSRDIQVVEPGSDWGGGWRWPRITSYNVCYTKLLRVLTAVQSKIAAFPRDYPPIRMAIEIHDLVRSKSGRADPYADIKNAANAVCRECVPMLMQHIAWSLDPLKTATQLAIAVV